MAKSSTEQKETDFYAPVQFKKAQSSFKALLFDNSLRLCEWRPNKLRCADR